MCRDRTRRLFRGGTYSIRSGPGGASMRIRFVVGSSCWLVGFVVACGGSAPAGLFDDLPSDTGEGGAGASSADGAAPPSSHHDAGTGGGQVDPDASPSPVDAQADATLDATIDAP